MAATDRLLRLGDVMERTGLSRTTLWRLERRGQFPRRRRIVGNIIGWREAELAEWIEGRPVVELPPESDQ